MDTELRILTVEDSEGYRELYTHWLTPEHSVVPAPNGTEGLERLDDRVDIVLLDRNMPGPSGAEVALAIEDSPHDPHVVMVSSMEPDFDIVEFPIDGYLQKPVSEVDIRGVVDQYRAQRAYKDALDEFFSLTAKVAAIEARTSETERADSEEYARLTDRIEAKRQEVDEALAAARVDWETTFKACTEDVTTEIEAWCL